MLKIFLFLSLFNSLIYANEKNQYEDSYKLGEGLQVSSLPLYVGGYFSLDYKQQDQENRYRVDDLAALVYGSYEKFSYMAELEFKQFYVLTDSNGTHTLTQDKRLHVERLYVDYSINENYKVRLGKFNSPIGFWNLLPINVLRDTTSSPQSTYILFPRFTTGAQISYEYFSQDEYKLDFIAQKNKDIDDTYNNYKTDEHFALSGTYTTDDLSVKLDVGMFDNLEVNKNNEERYYILGSMQYEKENYKFSAEIGSQHSNKEFTTQYAGYAQGMYFISEKHAAILRLEAYNDKVKLQEQSMAIAAYTYRPVYPVALKVEYGLSSVNKDSRFLCSFSVLF